MAKNTVNWLKYGRKDMTGKGFAAVSLLFSSSVKTTMPLFVRLDTTNYSFIIASNIDQYITINQQTDVTTINQ
jgi:hypothetical protein